MAFQEACRFAKRIETALIEGEIKVSEDGYRLQYYDRSEEIIL